MAFLPVNPYASYSIPIFLPSSLNSFRIILRSLLGFAPSLSIQILISLMLEVFCACLKSGARVNRIIFPNLSYTKN